MTANENEIKLEIPDHVPAHLVKTFDYQFAEETKSDPHAFAAALHQQDMEIFWNTAYARHDSPVRGAWQVFKAEDVRAVLNNPEVFSSKNITGFPTMLGGGWRMAPLECDPPEQAIFRQALNPLFSPPAVAKLEADIARRAEELINAVKDDGGCEFMDSFGRPFPVTIIMELIGLPREELGTFLNWEYDLLHSWDPEKTVAAANNILSYLVNMIRDRVKNPQDDFVSFVTSLVIEGRKITENEAKGVCFLMFMGGLDTVASALGFHYRYLGTDLEAQRLVRSTPDLIPGAVEEMLRRFAVVTSHRLLAKDFEYKGVQMKAGDWISYSAPAACLDPAEFDEPMKVDFERQSRHLAFAFGPHFCLGSHLARKEMIIALQKWCAMVPEFSVKPDAPIEVHGGHVFGIEHMELQW